MNYFRVKYFGLTPIIGLSIFRRGRTFKMELKGFFRTYSVYVFYLYWLYSLYGSYYYIDENEYEGV